ncbi:hypothetical protein [Tenggerimyces flavus]|uniref:Uncharacterized protein n=1 Tax=Tenggerimyces flavus TaxID=1708749 RepID=A0ABV7YA61_9ACTN|nr:hypothetical protein [Tenggerimyces flavus]MBM7788857.1 hypothetical protein [Tenggerimyces flavus]
MPFSGSVTVAGTVDPAAGVEMTVFTVPAGQVWELQTLRFALVTSATAATRRVHLVFDDGTNILARFAVLSTQIASLTYNYTFARDVDNATETGLEVVTRLPRLLLPTGFRVRTITENLQVGDNFSAGVYGYTG